MFRRNYFQVLKTTLSEVIDAYLTLIARDREDIRYIDCLLATGMFSPPTADIPTH